MPSRSLLFLRKVPRVLVGAFLVAACTENPTAPPDPSFVISDGANDGNEHFFFLPPMLPDPEATGTFDGSVSPEVQVCAWDGDACTAMLALFNTDAGYGSETVRVDEAEEHYIVSWHTAEILDDYPLGAGDVYRVRVLAEGQELGYADLAVVSSGKELKNVNSDEYIPLKEGRTLAIRFRIEEGALVDEAVAPLTAVGFSHSCAVATDGRAYCWGGNRNGELGIGTTGFSAGTPQLVVGGHSWQSVQAGGFSTCGLTTDGEVFCWGQNAQGQMGIGVADLSPHPSPEPVLGGLTFASLVTGSPLNHYCAITAAGDMYCWGLNVWGQVGNGTISFSEPTPTLVVGGHNFGLQASAGPNTSCGITTADDVLCWGWNRLGQLGRGFTGGSYPTPALVVGGHKFTTIGLGYSHGCGITNSGPTYCWGPNSSGELGSGGPVALEPIPQLVVGGHMFSQVGGGWRFSCAVTTDGAGYCWGQNPSGELGRGFASAAERWPEPVAGGHSFRSISPGSSNACGVAEGGELYCWGEDNLGWLGTGTVRQSSTPVLAIDLDPSSSP